MIASRRRTPDLVVVVRYPGYTRRAVIRKARTRKHTSAQRWYFVRWLDMDGAVSGAAACVAGADEMPRVP